MKTSVSLSFIHTLFFTAQKNHQTQAPSTDLHGPQNVSIPPHLDFSPFHFRARNVHPLFLDPLSVAKAMVLIPCPSDISANCFPLVITSLYLIFDISLSTDCSLCRHSPPKKLIFFCLVYFSSNCFRACPQQ